MHQNTQQKINGKISRALNVKKFESFMNLFGQMTEEVKVKNRKHTKKLKPKELMKLIRTKIKKNEQSVSRYDIEIIRREIPNIEEFVNTLLQHFNIQIIHNDTTDTNDTNVTNDVLENITHKVPLETPTNDPDALQYIGEQGIQGPRGVHGRDGKLLSTIDKEVEDRLHNINNKLDKIIEKIKI